MPPRLLRALPAAALIVLVLPVAAPAQSSAISAYPSPGTISAGPATQISFRGAPRSRLGTIRVTGSGNGR
jgi:hypothetical protein